MCEYLTYKQMKKRKRITLIMITVSILIGAIAMSYMRSIRSHAKGQGLKSAGNITSPVEFKAEWFTNFEQRIGIEKKQAYEAKFTEGYNAGFSKGVEDANSDVSIYYPDVFVKTFAWIPMSSSGYWAIQCVKLNVTTYGKTHIHIDRVTVNDPNGNRPYAIIKNFETGQVLWKTNTSAENVDVSFSGVKTIRIECGSEVYTAGCSVLCEGIAVTD